MSRQKPSELAEARNAVDVARLAYEQALTGQIAQQIHGKAVRIVFVKRTAALIEAETIYRDATRRLVALEAGG